MRARARVRVRVELRKICHARQRHCGSVSEHAFSSAARLPACVHHAFTMRRSEAACTVHSPQRLRE